MERSTEQFELASSATRTASGAGSWRDVSNYEEMVIFLKVSAASGTLDVKIQGANDDKTIIADLGDSFSQVISTTPGLAIKVTNFGKYIRAYWTIGGTTPSFTFVIYAVAKS
jgi:hypothetical protein